MYICKQEQKRNEYAKEYKKEKQNGHLPCHAPCERSPLFTGVSDNVEFVKKNSEHLERHNGNYRNKTEGELIKRK